MSEQQKLNQDQEIDLSQISKSLSQSYRNFNGWIFRQVQFLFRKKYVLGGLFLLGFGIGFYLDITSKLYDNRIIVGANLSSVDYLYSKIDFLESKIKDRDTVFLKRLGISNPGSIRKIEIEPVIDVYRFMADKETNIDLLKLMAEDGDIQKLVKENTTSKNYPSHQIHFVTSKKVDEKGTVEPLMRYLNDSKYFRQLLEQYVANIKIKIISNDSIISQIDRVLESFSQARHSSGGEKMVYINEDTQLDDVIKTKNELVQEQGALKLSLLSTDKIIKDASHDINILNTESTAGKLKLIMPLILILLYLLIFRVTTFYRKQKQISQQAQ